MQCGGQQQVPPQQVLCMDPLSASPTLLLPPSPANDGNSIPSALAEGP